MAEKAIAQTNPALLIDDPEKTLLDLFSYYDAGGRAVVDAQPAFLGRSAETLKDLSEKSDVHVIASTGFHRLMYYTDSSPVLDLDESALTDLYTRELSEGMVKETRYAEIPEYTDIRAGQIKTALEAEFTGTHKKLFRAAANASARTGAPVMIHVEKGSDPLKLLGFMTSLGVAPDRQIYCHLDRFIPDRSVHKEIAREGAFLEYDTIARPKYHSHEFEMALIYEMLEAGVEERLLFSLDTTRARLKGYGGSPGLDFLLTDVIPDLQKHGVAKDTIDKIFVGSPASLYAVPFT